MTSISSASSTSTGGVKEAVVDDVVVEEVGANADGVAADGVDADVVKADVTKDDAVMEDAVKDVVTEDVIEVDFVIEDVVKDVTKEDVVKEDANEDVFNEDAEKEDGAPADVKEEDAFIEDDTKEDAIHEDVIKDVKEEDAVKEEAHDDVLNEAEREGGATTDGIKEDVFDKAVNKEEATEKTDAEKHEEDQVLVEDVIDEESGAEAKDRHAKLDASEAEAAIKAAKEGKIIGGDWRKVISGRRGATCSVEVIAKMKLDTSVDSIDQTHEQREYCTKSHFDGKMDAVGMHGECSYAMNHGVTYEGMMLDGRCVGPGTLTYPNKGRVDGTFYRGQLTPATFTFDDGLVYELENWKYCTSSVPDRRFQNEIKYGLRPVCASLKTQQQPTRVIPPGCYDTGDGFYDPATRCVTSPVTGLIIRIPTNAEAKWIAENCRKAWDEPVGYRSWLREEMKANDINYAPLLMSKQVHKP